MTPPLGALGHLHPSTPLVGHWVKKLSPIVWACTGDGRNVLPAVPSSTDIVKLLPAGKAAQGLEGRWGLG